jgi:hypothetical protein
MFSTFTTYKGIKNKAVDSIKAHALINAMVKQSIISLALSYYYIYISFYCFICLLDLS